jgi:hypothetical protein
LPNISNFDFCTASRVEGLGGFGGFGSFRGFKDPEVSRLQSFKVEGFGTSCSFRGFGGWV